MICFDDLVVQSNRPRLIPSYKQTERRLLSIFLAVLEISPQLRGAFLEQCGYRSGKTCTYASLMEVQYKGSQYPDVRPDGLVMGTRGKNEWAAFIEAKAEKSAIRTDQILDYVSLAAKTKVDAIITISNEFSREPSELPYHIAQSKRKSINIFHFAWADIRTFLELQKAGGFLGEVEQLVLEQCLHFFWEPSSGIQNYDQMPATWPAFVEAAGTALGFGANMKGLTEIIHGWQQERRDLSSKLTHFTKSNIEIKHFAGARATEEERLKAERSKLADQYCLYAEYQTKKTKASLTIEADLNACRITSALEVTPPENKGARATVTWLSKLLSDWSETDLVLSFDWPGRVPDTTFPLQKVLEDPSLVFDGKPDAPRRIRIIVNKQDVRRFKSRKKFVEDVETLALFSVDLGKRCGWV
jgi:hypothetical protein